MTSSADLLACYAIRSSLSGFLHLASSFDSGLLSQPTAAVLLVRHMVGPKPAGAFVLHSLSSAISLQVALYFSSLAALAMTSAVYRGLGSYSSANLYVDGLACVSRFLGRLSCSLQMANVAEQGSGALIPQQLVLAPGTVRISLAQYTASLASSILSNVPRAACSVLPVSSSAVLREFDKHSRTLVGEYDQVASSCALERELSMASRLAQFRASVRVLDQAVNGPVAEWPLSAAVVVVGCGLTGLIVASAFAKAGESLLVIEKAPSVGGVWRWYSNPHSRVNSTEPCYRLDVRRMQPNTNHSYCHEILDDIRCAVAQQALASCIRLNAHAMSVYRVAGDDHARWRVSGKTTTRGASKPFSVLTLYAVLATNRRLGQPRSVRYTGEDQFAGIVRRGLAGEVGL